MKLGIVKEVHAQERRVAASPQTVQRLVKAGWEVLFESGAGESASFPDEGYREAGATMVDDAKSVWTQSDIIAKVRAPAVHPVYGDEAELPDAGTLIISFFFPAQNEPLIEQLAARNVSLIAIDCIPRISRAQKVDALSSMANIAGYRAVVEAANRFGSFFTGQYTAAGKVPPAKVLIIGAGVAGLAAVAAARGLGAIVRAFDTRAAVKEQVESLGGEFLEVEYEESGEGKGGYAKVMSKEFIEAEMALFREQAKEVNIVITTALIPGKKAPTLWTADMVNAMKPGSVVVDMAAEQGGNCELTKHGEVVVEHGVSIIGYSDLPSRMSNVSSDLYGTNLWHLLDEMGGAEDFTIDLDNDIVRGALVLKDGEVMWPPPPPKEVEPEVKETREGALPDAVAVPDEEPKPGPKQGSTGGGSMLLALVAIAVAGGWVYMRATMGSDSLSPSTREFLQHLTVFVLACFVGWQVVWNVTPALHTPLMSVTNAISGIIIVGGILQGVGDDISAPLVIGAVATLFATINVVGGFWVTQRMLKMFRRD
jgi:NAD(P) transhydrogenase subunit alpha